MQQCAATYTSACETPSPHCCDCCETQRCANFSTCGAEGWLAPTGACAAPAWARWPLPRALGRDDRVLRLDRSI